MGKVVKKVCKCENCGNESEMIITCSLPPSPDESEDTFIAITFFNIGVGLAQAESFFERAFMVRLCQEQRFFITSGGLIPELIGDSLFGLLDKAGETLLLKITFGYQIGGQTS